MDRGSGAVFKDAAEVRGGEEKLTGELFQGQILSNVAVDVGEDGTDQSGLTQIHAQCRNIVVALIL